MSEAADKLARTRLAIIAHLQRRERQREHGGSAAGEQEVLDGPVDADGQAGGRRRRRGPGESRPTGNGWFGRTRRLVTSWWRHHPAHTALDLATPALSEFAARKPFQYLGIAALAGAAIALARPWRVVSMTGLVLAVLKSSQLSSVVLSALAGGDDGPDEGPSV